ncbi:hypothetical protein HDV06_005672 [Boothiomyces sp. JEL0866]|nr:hypothetical protein HDV06_005672 [Boothiomyces sp. JEL0866]
MHLNHLPVEIQVGILNYLSAEDLPYVSLTNKYYFDFLSPYRLFKLPIFKYFYKFRNLQLLLAQDRFTSFGGGDLLLDQKLLGETDHLMQLSNGIFKFQFVEIGGRFYQHLHHHLPNAHHLTLVLHSRSTANIPWDDITQSDLHKINRLKLYTDISTVSGALENLYRFTGLKELVLDRSTDNDQYVINWATIFHSIVENKVRKLSIAAKSLLNHNSRLFASYLPSTILWRLEIINCSLNDDTLLEISKILPDCAIEVLILKGNLFTDSGAIGLSKHLPSTGLKHLNLNYNKIGSLGLHKLAESIPYSKLLSFEIEENDCHFNDTAKLYGILGITQLEYLKVPECGPIAESALIGSINRSKIKTLDINISPDNLGLLFAALHNSAVETLILAFDDSIIERIEIISNYIQSTTLREIQFNTDYTFYKISLWTLFINLSKESRLQDLDVSDIGLDASEFEMIANHLPNTNLTALAINCNEITDKYLRTLGVAVTESLIKSLTICVNAYTNDQLTSEGVIQFIEIVAASKLRRLEFTYRVLVRSAGGILVGNDLDLQLSEDWDHYHPSPNEMDLRRDNIKLKMAKQLEALGKGVYKFSNIAIGGQMLSILHSHLPQSEKLDLCLTSNSKARINWDSISDAFMEKITGLKLIRQSRNATNVLKHFHRMSNLDEIIVDGIMDPHDLKTLWDVIYNVLRYTKAVTLEIANNPNINQCAQLLASMIPSSNLQDLTIYCCEVDDEFLQTIAHVLPDSKLKSLNLQSNYDISDFSPLANVLPNTKLTSLNVAYNNMEEEDVRVLSEGLASSDITEFFITSEPEDDMLAPLYGNLHNLKLNWLDVIDPGPESEDALISSIAKSNLKSIELDISLGNLDRFFQAAKRSLIPEITLKITEDVQDRIDILADSIRDTQFKKITIYSECGSDKPTADCFGLFSNLTKETPLKEFDLTGLMVKKEEITLIFIQLPFTNLECLKINCPEMTDKEFDNLIPAINLSLLTFLYIGGRPKVTGSALIKFISRLNTRHLKKLVVEGIRMTSFQRRELRNMLGDNPKLKVGVSFEPTKSSIDTDSLVDKYHRLNIESNINSYLKAASSGNSQLSICLDTATKKQDYAKAFNLLNNAASISSAEAPLTLAYKWFMKSAEQGFGTAADNIELLVENGYTNK